jgi:hypothetical protein
MKRVCLFFSAQIIIFACGHATSTESSLPVFDGGSRIYRTVPVRLR